MSHFRGSLQYLSPRIAAIGMLSLYLPTALGNWQFTATSTVSGKAPLTFAGSIGQAGATISSALHVQAVSKLLSLIPYRMLV